MSAPGESPQAHRPPWLFFAILLVLPMIAVITVTALDVTVYLERWVSSLLD